MTRGRPLRQRTGQPPSLLELNRCPVPAGVGVYREWREWIVERMRGAGGYRFQNLPARVVLRYERQSSLLLEEARALLDECASERERCTNASFGIGK